MATAAESVVEPPSGHIGETSESSAHEGGHAPEQPAATSPTDTDDKPVPTITHYGSGLQITYRSQSKKNKERGTKNAPKKTVAHTQAEESQGYFDPARTNQGKEAHRLQSLERDVSPGTRADGTHAQTSGDRGESYVPSKISMFKGKLFHGAN